MPKIKEKKQVFAVYPIEAWSVKRQGVKLYINPDWGISFYDGMSLDVEDDGKGNMVGIGMYDPKLNVCYYWTEPWPSKFAPKFIAHNGISDLKKLQKWGFNVEASNLMCDTMLTAHILDSSRKQYGLKKLVKEEFGVEYPSYEDLCGKKNEKTLADLPLELVAEYNACDTYWTYKLYEKQRDVPIGIRSAATTYFSKLEAPVAPILHSMEERGISVDLAYLKQLKDSLEAKRSPIEEAIKAELGDINLNSPKQLIGALNAKQIQPSLKGKSSVDKRALEPLRQRYPIVETLLRYSELDTLISSFVNPYLERNETVVHPHFNQCGTRTGRLSCSNPNLLQIPKRTDNGKLVRKMFVARKGMLLGDCDFGQIEPRLLAHLSKDANLCQLFNDGTNFHKFTQTKLGFPDTDEGYARAKILNLSVGYRATFKSVSQQMKCSWDEAQKHIDRWWAAFPGLYDWQQQLIHITKQTGYCTTLMGRRLKVDDLNNPNPWRREGAERQLINNITQGSAAEIMKAAMIAVSRANIDILVQVYDELVIESPEECISSDLEILVDKMITTTMLRIPLTVDSKVGLSWGEMK